MEVRPEAVATELCPTRWAALEESADAAKNWRSLARQLVRKKQRERMALGWYLIDSADQMVIQQIEFWRQHERNGFQEGVEALAVGDAAARVGAQVVLIDRPYEVTQLRKELAGEEGQAADRLRRLEHSARKLLALSLTAALVAAFLRSGSVPTFLLFYTLTATKSVLSGPVGENAVAHLAYCYGRVEEYRTVLMMEAEAEAEGLGKGAAPAAGDDRSIPMDRRKILTADGASIDREREASGQVDARVVIAERDEIMAWALRDCPDARRFSTLVAVVGAAHLQGIRRIWGSSRAAAAAAAAGESFSSPPAAACGPQPVDPRPHFGLPPVKGALLQQFGPFLRAYRLPRGEVASVGATGPRVFAAWLEQRRAAEVRVNSRLRERRRELVQAAAGPVLSGITVYYVESARDRSVYQAPEFGWAAESLPATRGRAPPPEPTSRFFLARRDVDAYFNARGLRVADWHVCSAPLDAAYDFFSRRHGKVSVKLHPTEPAAAAAHALAAEGGEEQPGELSEGQYLSYCTFDTFPVFQVVRVGTGDNALVQTETQRQVWFTSPERAQLAIRRAIKSAGPAPSPDAPGSMVIRARALGEVLRVIEESVNAGVEPGVFLLE